MKAQRGVTLLEVVIAIAVLGIVAATVAGYFNWSLGVFKHTDVRATEESIARTEMEIIKGMPYDETVSTYLTGTAYSEYKASNVVYANASGTLGLQKIVVTVARNDAMAGSQSIELEGYKLDR